MPLPRLVARAVALGTMGAVASCSAIVDFDGLAGGSADASLDAQKISDSANATDVTANDASNIGADTSSQTDANLTFCQSQGSSHAFCADFEDVLNVGDGWSAKDIDQGGSIALDSLGSSSSKSMRTDIPSGACLFSALYEQFPAAPSSISSATLSFDFRSGNSAGSGDFKGGYLAVVQAGECQWMFFAAGTGSSAFQIQDVPVDASEQNDDFDLAAQVAIGAWTHAEIDISFSSAPSVSISIGGAVVAGPHSAYAACAAGTPLAIQLGFFCSNGAEEARIDNVLFDYQ